MLSIGRSNRLRGASPCAISIGALLFFAVPIAEGAAIRTAEPVSLSAVRVSLGAFLFSTPLLSSDSKISCSSCHDPAHAYADTRPRSVGVNGTVGTRNAPSLIGVENYKEIFWDGRRMRLRDVVLDPFTNPVELGLSSVGDLLERLGDDAEIVTRFAEAFPHETGPPITADHVATALVDFIGSLSGQTVYSRVVAGTATLSEQAEQGLQLFSGVAGCSQCHLISKTTHFSDDRFHQSGIDSPIELQNFSTLTREVVTRSLAPSVIGKQVLANMDWSTLGRFVVTHRAEDVGAFRTPSLRNVAATAPYMHDGSIQTLSDAIDHEIYYHAAAHGRAVNLTAEEREDLLRFLETLTESN